ncbi:hypothetical protein Leryth_015788 [Lithospermum erythrorhizon]|nr:hypothetical protein Leryth_015788 [Lithospermum erythrorhizon]
MADASSQNKRKREEEIVTSYEEQEDSHYPIKHQKPYTQILSILDEDEEEFNQDYLSDIFSTLQQELSSSKNSIDFDNLVQNNDVQENDQVGSCSSSQSSNEEDCNNVMRHLLEASDDELGLPNMGNDGSYDGENIIKDIPFHVNVGLFEIEDEAANYYAMLQSELFM